MDKYRAESRSIGFVPTMGALHEGHASLVKTAESQVDIIVVSIFVNPLQFNNPQDFETYPSRTDQDVAMLVTLGVDILFLPGQPEIYPNTHSANNLYDLGALEHIFEGAFRPGHFQGVCRVVDRLLHIVSPQRLYLGQKDFQQVMVIRRLIHLLELDVEVVVVPTKRESNGLAMSSRNLKLSAQQKAKAALISWQLQTIKNKSGTADFEAVRSEAVADLEHHGLEVEYIALAHATDLSMMQNFDRQQPMVLLAAVYVDGIRLIDNLVF